MTSYRITIKRKDGTIFVKVIKDKRAIELYKDQAKKYGDTIVKIEELDDNGNLLRDITNLALVGIGTGVLFGMLRAMKN